MESLFKAFLKGAFKYELKTFFTTYSSVLWIIGILAVVAFGGYYIYKRSKHKQQKQPTAKPAPQAPQPLTCPNCHASVSPEDRFCLKCGTALKAAAPQSAADSAPNNNLKKFLIGGGIALAILGISFGFLLSLPTENTPNTAPPAVQQQQKQDNAPPANPNKQQPTQQTAPKPPADKAYIDEAQTKFTAFHHAITNHQLRNAYNCLSQDFQSKMTYDGWAPGFNTTLSSRPSNIRVISAEPTKVEFSYDLQSRDRVSSGIKVQNFQGTVIMIKENNVWVIDSISAKKQGEHFE